MDPYAHLFLQPSYRGSSGASSVGARGLRVLWFELLLEFLFSCLIFLCQVTSGVCFVLFVFDLRSLYFYAVSSFPSPPVSTLASIYSDTRVYSCAFCLSQKPLCLISSTTMSFSVYVFSPFTSRLSFMFLVIFLFPLSFLALHFFVILSLLQQFLFSLFYPAISLTPLVCFAHYLIFSFLFCEFLFGIFYFLFASSSPSLPTFFSQILSVITFFLQVSYGISFVPSFI